MLKVNILIDGIIILKGVYYKMYIVKDKKSGLYVKIRTHLTWSKGFYELVEKNNATVYRTIGGVKNSLGRYIPFEHPKRNGRYGVKFGHKELDTDKWEIEEIIFTEIK